MLDVLNGILVFIAFVATFYAFGLLMQFLSKISGKNFYQKGSGQIVSRPTDFNDSIQDIKFVASKIDDSIRMLSLDAHGKIIYRFEKILKLSPKLKLSDFNNLISQHLDFSEKLKQEKNKDEHRITLDPNTGEIKSFRLVNPDDYFKQINYFKFQLVKLETRLIPYNELFKNREIEKICVFFSDYVKTDDNKLILLINSIGCENLKKFCDEIDNLERIYSKGKITQDSIIKIKLLILKQKGLILSVIITQD